MVAGGVAVGVVDGLEVIDIEHEEGERQLVPQGEEKIARKLPVEVLAVEGGGQAVAGHGFEKASLQALLQLVLQSELEDCAPSEQHLVALSKHRAFHPFSRHKRAVGAVPVLDDDALRVAQTNPGVKPRDAVVLEDEIAAGVAADGHSALRDVHHATHIQTAQDDEAGLPAALPFQPAHLLHHGGAVDLDGLIEVRSRLFHHAAHSCNRIPDPVRPSPTTGT